MVSSRRNRASAPSRLAGRFSFESLEGRRLLHGGGFEVMVNFQPAGSAVPTGYVADAGALFGDRGNGFAYGWDLSTPYARDRNSAVSADQRFDTLNHMQKAGGGGVWEIEVPNGTYGVRVVAGDPAAYDSNYAINVEGVLAVSGKPMSTRLWFDGTKSVSVTDGRLTVSNAAGSINNKIGFIDIHQEGVAALPAVSVMAPDPSAAEADRDPGTFVVSRRGDTTEALTVNYTLGGSATAGVDFASPGGAVTILAGAASAWVTIDPLDDATAEDAETIVLSLSASPAYDVAAPSSATVTLADDDAPVVAFAARVNFQTASAPVPAGYVADAGAVFGDRGNGLAYGWNVSNASLARDRNSAISPDQRYDTLTHTQAGGATVWEIVVPNGAYSVRVVAGDPSAYNSTYAIAAEGVTVVSGKPTSTLKWLEGTASVTVADGRLTLTNAAGAVNNKIGFIDIIADNDSATGTTLSWNSVAPTTVGRSEGMGAVVGGKLYLFGGYIDTTFKPTSRGDVYDPAANRWTQIASLPFGVSHMGTVAVGDSIYFAGGYPATSTGQSFATNAVWRYDTQSNTFATNLPKLPAPRGGGALVAVGRVLHFFGGSDAARKDAAQHWQLDLDQLSAGWVAKAPLLLATNHVAGTVVGGKIYAIGGQQNQDRAAVQRAEVQVYDPATNAWTARAPLPLARSHITSATFVQGGRILVLGGLGPGNRVISRVDRYDPVTNTWSALASLPAGRLSGISDVLPDGRILFATGSMTKTTWVGSFV